MADMDSVHYMYDLSDQLADSLRRKAEAFFAAEAAEKEKVFADRAAFEARRDRINAHFAKALGGLDLPRTPLNTQYTGTLQRDGYEIRKLIFESRPGFHVTCSLYIPEQREAKAPGILFVCGHGKHAKAHSTYQKACIDLARNGMVVLAMDCVGQGERMQYIDQATGRTFVRYGTTEHSYAGQQFTLTGGCVAQVFVWDMIRALDVLCELDFVDAKRLGVTGASGGGTQSSYLMMADPRLAAAAPCNYLTSREEYMKTGQSHDGEQNQYGAIKEGLNNDDFVLAFAPKPLMIGSVSSDFFCIEGVEKTFARGRKAYALYGREDGIRLKTAFGTHNLNDELRQAVVNFFRKTFLGLPEDFVTDTAMAIEDPETLYCVPHGQVLRDFPGETTISDLTAARVKNTKRDVSAGNAAKVVTDFFEIPKETERIAIRPRYLSVQAFDEHATAMPTFFFSEPNIAVCGMLLKDTKNAGKKTLVVYTSLEGTKKQRLHASALEELLSRCDVLDFDPRGLGSARSRTVNRGGSEEAYECIYGTLFKLNYDSIMLGTSLMAQQVFDVVRAYELGKQMGYEEILFAGHGYGAVLALLAAAATGARAELENLPPSFAEMASTRIFPYHPLNDVYDLLNHFDTPELIAALGGRVTVRNVPDPGICVL